MLTRAHHLLLHYSGPAPDETRQLEAEGYCILRGVFGGRELKELRDEVLEVFRTIPGDRRAGITSDQAAAMYRYQMLNRSALAQRAMAHPRILEVVDPLVGNDCHAINSTAWKNPPGEVPDPGSYYWHVDGGPHVPRPPGVRWPAEIPYPIFVIASHVYLDDCALDDGPTTVVPTSHRSGLPVPEPKRFDAVLEYEGHRPVSHIVRAGDVGFFVSDVWHRRRLPTARSRGRFFLQTNYGRRDIAQRVLPTDVANQVSPEALARATTPRERTLIGLHPATFYDG